MITSKSSAVSHFVNAFGYFDFVIGISRGLGWPVNGSSFDSFGLLKCALKWSLMMFDA